MMDMASREASFREGVAGSVPEVLYEFAPARMRLPDEPLKKYRRCFSADRDQGPRQRSCIFLESRIKKLYYFDLKFKWKNQVDLPRFSKKWIDFIRRKW